MLSLTTEELLCLMFGHSLNIDDRNSLELKETRQQSKLLEKFSLEIAKGYSK